MSQRTFHLKAFLFAPLKKKIPINKNRELILKLSLILLLTRPSKTCLCRKHAKIIKLDS